MPTITKPKIDLSGREGSMTEIIETNMDLINAVASVPELVTVLKTIFAANGLDTKASNRLIRNVAMKRNLEQAWSAVTNSYLAGTGNDTIKTGRSWYKFDESAKKIVSEDIQEIAVKTDDSDVTINKNGEAITVEIEPNTDCIDCVDSDDNNGQSDYEFFSNLDPDFDIDDEVPSADKNTDNDTDNVEESLTEDTIKSYKQWFLDYIKTSDEDRIRGILDTLVDSMTEEQIMKHLKSHGWFENYPELDPKLNETLKEQNDEIVVDYILEDDDIIFDDATGNIMVPSDLIDFAAGRYVNIKFTDDNDKNNIHQYKITTISNDDEYITLEYIDTINELETLDESKSIKESKDFNPDIWKAIGQHFDYSIPEKTAEVFLDLVDRALSQNEEDTYDAVSSAINDGLIYDSDIWQIISFYEPAELSDETYSNLLGDTAAIVDIIKNGDFE